MTGACRTNLRALAHAATATGAAISSASAQPVLTNLGSLGNSGSYAAAVSADGTTVVGTCNVFAPRAYRWTAATGMQALDGGQALGLRLPGCDYSTALGVSGDGSVVVGGGNNQSGSVARAFRWMAGAGITELTATPVAGAGANAAATAVSPDGDTVTGMCRVPGAQVYQAAKWSGQGMTLLPVTLVNNESRGIAVANDGTVVGSSDNGPHLWRPDGTPVPLGPVSPQIAGGVTPYGMSPDGSVVVGVANVLPFNGFDRGMFRWTEATGVENVGLSTYGKIGYAVSSGGKVIVGGNTPFSSQGDRAFAWTRGRGVFDLRDYLVAHGVSMHSISLHRATGVSADGTTIVGNGSFGADGDRAWILTNLNDLEACNRADVGSVGGRRVSDGQLTADDVIIFLAGFFEQAYLADLVVVGGSIGRDGQWTADDVVAFLASFFAGCP